MEPTVAIFRTSVPDGTGEAADAATEGLVEAEAEAAGAAALAAGLAEAEAGAAGLAAGRT